LLKVLLIIAVIVYFGGKLFPWLGSFLGGHSRKPFRQAKWMWAWAAGSEEDAIQAEHEYGAECARQFAGQFSGHPPRAAQALVEAVGASLAAAVEGSRRTFQFRVVRAGAANAYALPGGFIFITEPLIGLCREDRDEIAFFLGHEIAHVALGHARSQLAANTLLNAVTARLSGAGMLLRELLAKGYSRDLELEADREGARLAAAAGFNPHAPARALQRLAQVSSGDAGLAEYFSSHPPLAERVGKLA
jgi:predicted Zn-dependent protease